MRRSLLSLSLILATVAVLPRAAEAAVVSTVSADTLNISGDAAADRITLRLAPGAPGTLEVDTESADFSFDRATFTKISVRSGAGSDDIRIDESNGTLIDEATTIESGAGADIVLGGRGAEVIASGEDNDLVHAGAGDDSLLLGGGDDTVVQGPLDGFDVFDGQSGFDTVQTSGTGESEEFTVQVVGAEVRISRDVGGAGTDMTGIEVAELNAAGGPDLVDVGDLSGTELTRLDADLGLADGARDTVFAAGSDGIDSIGVSSLGDAIRVTGLRAEVRLQNVKSADDRRASATTASSSRRRSTT
jgi:Ca2+-binding RTX toxin-like protein